MFWSKIWLFVAAAIAAIALTIAFAVPKPASRHEMTSEGLRLRRACQMSNILMKDNARARIQLTQEFSTALRTKAITNILIKNAAGATVSAATNASARKELNALLDDIQGTKPSFILLIDPQGRIAAQAGDDHAKEYGESLKGFYLVDDALAGHVLDDLWIRHDELYRIAGAPVFNQSLEWAGAIVLGQKVDTDFAASMKENLQTSIAFYNGTESSAASDAIPIHAEILEHSKTLMELDEGSDCVNAEILQTSGGEKTYQAALARLPGEAGQLGAFYAVFVEQQVNTGLKVALGKVGKSDLSFGSFPWIPIGALFLGLIGIGLFLMSRESDKPLKKLNVDALALAKGEKERMDESQRGKFGGVARSVNIALDKAQRAAEAAHKNMDDLLGAAPDDLGSGHDALPAAPSLPVTTPPPSAFKFSGQNGLGIEPPPPGVSQSSMGLGLDEPTHVGGNFPPEPKATDRFVAPQPVRLPTPPPTPMASLNDDILGGASLDEPTEISAAMPAPLSKSQDTQDFREIYKEFVALKTKCGENTSNLTFERFKAKLERNSETLIAKHNCKTVRFKVYEKDGKAALKASPVRG